MDIQQIVVPIVIKQVYNINYILLLRPLSIKQIIYKILCSTYIEVNTFIYSENSKNECRYKLFAIFLALNDFPTVDSG